ncbi:unnamed protein product, partial [Discosporangium mesarthrocarpum]
VSVELLLDGQARPLEAAVAFMDVTGLGRAQEVCRGWRWRLGGEGGGAGEWKRCVRLPHGVPSRKRAQFYMHVLYDRPSWLHKVQGGRRRAPVHPALGSYMQHLEQAEDTVKASPASPAPCLSPHLSFVLPVCHPCLGGRKAKIIDGTPVALRQRWTWIQDIETDLLRTCPSDDEVEDPLSPSEVPCDDCPEPGSERPGAEVTPRLGDTAEVGVGAGRSKGRSSTISRCGKHATADGSALPQLVAGPGSHGIWRDDSESEMEGEGSRKGVTGTEAVAARSPGVGESMRDRCGGKTRDKLRRVLRAFAMHNRRVSYCQGMNFVALALLEVCRGDEETAFWVLVGMCERLDLEGMWCQGLQRLEFCFFALERLLMQHCPSLQEHLREQGVNLSMFTSRWFVTFFTSNDVFGRSGSRKVLDLFLVERWPLIFQVSLAVLLELQPLLEGADLEGIMKVTKFPRAQIFGLRSSQFGGGRSVAATSFKEAMEGSLCESMRADQLIYRALQLPIGEAVRSVTEREER